MRRLKFDNDTMRQVCTLVRNHSLYPQLTGKDVRRAAYQIGPELFDSFLLVKRADIMAHHPDVIPGKLDYLRELEHIWQDVQLHLQVFWYLERRIRKTYEFNKKSGHHKVLAGAPSFSDCGSPDVVSISCELRI